ncbi:YfbM family protein [Streptomyces iconiensis]|uniref:YfbM family protein n=1 Tax=Streptomyces iconiensis TaxID=1384038 RepID=A0ABT6ZNN9_9ACTN|nr:YfbM family protein [Streptomyces iconiensis]MDJ1130658.1 YfbM family protein [Streptomyces iconiensis]
MGMIANYARLTPTQLDRALRDPEWAHTHVLELERAAWQAGQPAPSQARFLDIDKTWGALAVLLSGKNVPVEVIFGDAGIPGAPSWGTSPPHALAPERVALAAELLGRISGAELTEGADTEKLEREDVCPAIWDEGEDALEYVRKHYEPLVEFVTAAAGEGEALLVWLN